VATLRSAGAPVAGDGVPALHLEAESLSLRASLVPWDTESFGVRVAQIDHLRVAAGSEAQAFADGSTLTAWLHEHAIRVASARLPESALRESFLLERLGFRFVEMVYAMRTEVLTADSASPPSLSLRWEPATQADLPILQRIAAAAFVTGRWQVDWRVGEALSGRRYADWVRRSLSDPHHRVVKALLDGEVAGFFITEARADGSVFWHLTAVDAAFRGRGVGRAMWQSMAALNAAEGATRLQTTIAARNLPVVNMYARLGWRFDGCQMTLHWMSEGEADE